MIQGSINYQARKSTSEARKNQIGAITATIEKAGDPGEGGSIICLTLQEKKRDHRM
jgi:hypothetical protein